MHNSINLPNDAEELKKLLLDAQDVIHSLRINNEQKEKRLNEQENLIIRLNEQLKSLKRNFMGVKSERTELKDYYERGLFNEAELGLHDEDTLFEEHAEEVNISGHTRRSRGRKKLPESLERKIVPHDIPDEEKICSCGCRLENIGSEDSEQLVVIPPEVYVRKNVRFKYACKNCKGDERQEAGKVVVTSPFKTPQLLPGSNLSPETLTFLLLSKFLDHIPFYRLSEMFLRLKIQLPRGTMSNWIIGVYERYKHLMGFFHDLLKEGMLIGIDETTYQVHNEKGRENTKKSYMWVLRGGLPNRTVIVYIYKETHSASFLKDYLDDFNGVIQTDGLETYNTHFKNNPDVILAGCMAHARRKFEDAYKQGKDKIAEKVLYYMRKLYAIEDKIRKQEYLKKGLVDKIVEIRQKEAKPILEYLHDHLSEIRSGLPESIGVGRAIRYFLNEYPKLCKYLDNGYIYIDNNLVENSVRPFVLGRKNWLFSDVPEGAHASAFYYSLIQTFKVNNLNVMDACFQFFSNLPECKSQDE
ncbi:IS66 family transposase, partial [bacterium]|nr:IS66 family transposase [bacterium]